MADTSAGATNGTATAPQPDASNKTSTGSADLSQRQPESTARAAAPQKRQVQEEEEWDDHLSQSIREEEQRQRDRQREVEVEEEEAQRRGVVSSETRGRSSSGGTTGQYPADSSYRGSHYARNGASADNTNAVNGAAGPKIVRPSDFLMRPSSQTLSPQLSKMGSSGDASLHQQLPVRKKPMTPIEREQLDGLRAIRAFLKVRTSYDVIPLSYRLIVLDTSLLVKKSLNILSQCGIVSAPLWDSKTSTFAGLLTTSDYLNVVQYYWQNPDALTEIDQFKLTSLRDIERALGVRPLETVSTHPMEPLYEACRRMLKSRARRIPLVDFDDETNRDLVVSVITQYRLLKFICVNVKETQMLRRPLRDIPQMGTYRNVCSARMDTPVIDVIQHLVNRSISAVPILGDDDVVLNVFEAVDVLMLIKGGEYENLQLSVGKALEKRPDDFPGIYTCTLNDRLDTIFDTVRKSRVHRFVVIDEAKNLKGLLSLSDILEYTLNSPLPDEDEGKE